MKSSNHDDKYNGSTIGWLNKLTISEIKIPVPRTDELLNEWVAKISEPYDAIQKKKELLKLEDVKAEVKRIGEEQCDMTTKFEYCYNSIIRIDCANLEQ